MQNSINPPPIKLADKYNNEVPIPTPILDEIKKHQGLMSGVSHELRWMELGPIEAQNKPTQCLLAALRSLRNKCDALEAFTTQYQEEHVDTPKYPYK